jgi:hypothetical protein
MLECLKDVVGITQSDCQCIINGIDGETLEKLRLSTSGLYLDDLPGGVHMKVLTRIDACRDMAQIALHVRDQAITTLEKDLIVALNTKYKKDKPNFVGQIGRPSYAGSLGVSRPWQGIRVRPNGWSDGVIKLTRLQIILNAAVTVTIRVFRVPLDSVMGEEILTWPVTTTANAYQVVNIGGAAISLPLIYNGEEVEYYFLYDISEPGVPVNPKDTGIHCSTCEGGKQPFSSYVTVWGVQANTTSTLNDKLTDNYSHGLILDVEIKCDNEKLFCRSYQEDDAVSVTMAHATWFKGGELLIEDVLKQPDINRYTTMDKERLWGKRNHFRKEYDVRVMYLTEVVDVAASNCYICREVSNQPFMAPIFS